VKKLIPFVSLCFIALSISSVKFARASTDAPHVVISGEVWMLDETGAKLFLLPDTYYARINNIDEQYYYIHFNGINGRVTRDIVSTTGYHTLAKGTTLTMGIRHEYNEFESIYLKKTPSVIAENVISIPTNESFTFIGEYPTAKEGVWYYIKYNQYYGYIKSTRTDIEKMTYEVFVPEISAVMAPDEEETSEGSEKKKAALEGNALKIVIIIGLSVPAILIILLLFKPGRKRKYYED
jgi:hypothetical protein